MPELYPEIEPYDCGMLPVGDGNLVYWDVSGNPQGKPAVFLHGGPGQGCSPGVRRYFDPSAYRIVLFDQRGSGRSTPPASDPATDLASNTTNHLIADMERLRRHLGIDRWQLLGGSWGCTLGLAYAEQHPDRVTEIILTCVATTRRWEIDWITRGVGRSFPEAWERYRAGVPEAERDGDLATAYHRLLEDPDPVVRAKAAKNWCDWEAAIVALGPDHKPNPRFEQPEFRLGFARLVTHYWSHQAFLEDGILLREAGALTGIPGILIHGRLDLSTPLSAAWELSQAWPGSELVVVEGAGHNAGTPGMRESILAATERFAMRG
jgi:proline iminopeptidase